jgi:hypothetical protein
MEKELVITILVDDYIITIYNTDDIYITIN